MFKTNGCEYSCIFNSVNEIIKAVFISPVLKVATILTCSYPYVFNLPFFRSMIFFFSEELKAQKTFLVSVADVFLVILPYKQKESVI